MDKSLQTKERIPSLDFLRGIAILGILFINIENFAFPDPWSPWKFGFKHEIDYTTRFWVYFLTQGKFYTMFAFLFGVGFYIFLKRLETKGLGINAMDIYARRLLWLFVIGVIHAYFIWDGDVLYHYSICGFLLFPFRSIKTFNLYWVIALLMVLQLNKSYEQTIKLKTYKDKYTKAKNIQATNRTIEEVKTIESWDKRTKKKEPDNSSIKIKKKTYWSGLVDTYNQSSVHRGLLYYQGLLFPTLMMMILGIIFYRLGIFQSYKKWKHYWLISFSILILGLIINYLRYHHWTYEYFKPITSVWVGWLFTFPKEILGVSYILILNGFYQKYSENIKLYLITCIGRTALSNYIFQNILLGFIFYGYGLAYMNTFSRTELIAIVTIIWLVQITLTWLWLRKFKQGPLEWLWRNLTYRHFENKSIK